MPDARAKRSLHEIRLPPHLHSLLLRDNQRTGIYATIWTYAGYDSDDQINEPGQKNKSISQTTNSNLSEHFLLSHGTVSNELLGRENGVDGISTRWSDGLMVDLGAPEWEGNWQEPKELANFHVDGWIRRSMLFAGFSGAYGNQAQGGRTMIAHEGINMIANHLYEHPEDVMPGGFDALDKIAQCMDFDEIAGNPGDVVFLHPFTVAFCFEEYIAYSPYHHGSVEGVL